MARIVYVESSGTRHELNVPEGSTVMDGAVRNGVPGIVAECGGSCACGTCHVHVDRAWIARLPARQEAETAMLEFSDDVDATSRLSCQIRVAAELDGLVVEIPVTQR